MAVLPSFSPAVSCSFTSPHFSALFASKRRFSHTDDSSAPYSVGVRDWVRRCQAKSCRSVCLTFPRSTATPLVPRPSRLTAPSGSPTVRRRPYYPEIQLLTPLSAAFIVSPWSDIASSYEAAGMFDNGVAFFLWGWFIFTFIMLIASLRSSIALSLVQVKRRSSSWPRSS